MRGLKRAEIYAQMGQDGDRTSDVPRGQKSTLRWGRMGIGRDRSQEGRNLRSYGAGWG